MQISQIEYEFINFLIHQRLLKLGEKHFSSLDLGIKLDSNFHKEWFVSIQCLYWFRIDEIEKHKEFFTGTAYDGYNPISTWEYREVLRNNIMTCVAKLLSYLDTKRGIKNRENLKESVSEYKIKELLEKYTDIINNKYELVQSIRKTNQNILYHKDRCIIYKDYIFEIDTRIQHLIDKCSVQQVLRMLLRYSGLGIDAMHCSLPYEVYKYFYDEFNVRGEGFSSPLNSKLIEFPGTVICTAFEDTDSCFGSIGRFSASKLIANSSFNWTVNPPYVESIINSSFNEIISAIDTIERNDFLAIYLIPKGKEEHKFYHQVIKQHKYVQKYIEPDVGTHYMNCNGTMVHMHGTVNAMFFISKSNKYKNIDEKRLMRIWNDENNDSSKGQSSFMRPIKIKDCNVSTKMEELQDNTSMITLRTDLPKSIREQINKQLEDYKKKK